MKKNQNGFSQLYILIIIVVLVLVAIIGWYVMTREKRLPITYNDTGGSSLLEASVNDCVKSKRATALNIPGTTDKYYEGQACFDFVNEDKKDAKMIVGLTFPTLKDTILKAGFYKGTCEYVKEQVYRLNDVSSGESGTTILVSIEEFAHGNKNPESGNGQPILAVFKQNDMKKPIACAYMSF